MSRTRPTRSIAILLTAAALSTYANIARAQIAALTFGGIAAPGQFDNEWGDFGRSVSAVGDLNGDKVADFIIGAPGQTAGSLEDAGRVYLWSGKTKSFIKMLTSPNKTPGGRFGRAVCGAPDLNGDGVADLLVGAPEEDATNGKLETGRVYVISGKGGGTIRILQPVDKNYFAQFGWAISIVPDADGDGTADIVVGAPKDSLGNNPVNSGAAYLFSGKTGAQLRVFAPPNPGMYLQYGSAVAGVPDVNGDGRGDIAVAGVHDNTANQPDECGRVYIYSGKSGALIRTLNSPGAEVQGFFGTGLAGLADLNGDGKGDILIGAPQEDPANDPNDCGRAYVFSGATGALLYKFIPPVKNLGGGFGASVARAGDLDGDGKADLLIGEPHGTWADKPNGTGAVHAYSGKTGKRIYSFGSPNAQSGGDFGRSIAGIPDTNANGKGDIIVGAPTEAPGGAPDGSGRVYLVR